MHPFFVIGFVSPFKIGTLVRSSTTPESYDIYEESIYVDGIA